MRKILVFVFAGVSFYGMQAVGTEDNDFYDCELPVDFSRFRTQPKKNNDDSQSCRLILFHTEEQFINHAMQVLDESYYDPYLEEKLEKIKRKERKKEEKERERMKDFPSFFREYAACRPDWSVEGGNKNPRRIGREAEGGGCCAIQ